MIFDVTKMKRLRLAKDSDDGLAIKYHTVRYVCMGFFFLGGWLMQLHIIGYSKCKYSFHMHWEAKEFTLLVLTVFTLLFYLERNHAVTQRSACTSALYLGGKRTRNIWQTALMTPMYIRLLVVYNLQCIHKASINYSDV